MEPPSNVVPGDDVRPLDSARVSRQSLGLPEGKDGVGVGSEDTRMGALLARCAPEAHYDSDLMTSICPPLHPKTRQDALSPFEAWIESPRSSLEASTPVLWFSGPAGSGKTTMQRELATRCCKEDRLLATFFFSMHSSHTSDEKLLVPTLAHQIASNIPGLWDYVSSAIQDDPDTFSRPLQDQMLGLVFQPLERYLRYSKHKYWWERLKGLPFQNQSRWSKRVEDCAAFKQRYSKWWNRSIIIVDGLDECIGRQQQRDIIELIAWASRHRKFPLRFIVSGPSDCIEIRHSFRKLNSIRPKILRQIALDTCSADWDMAVYLKHEFTRIRVSHPMAASISWPEDWPSQKTVDFLVVKAQNLFTYVATVIAFTDNPAGDPVELLDWLISTIPVPNSADYKAPFADLDALYTFILHYQADEILSGVIELRKRLLHAIVLSGKEFYTLEELDEYLALPPGSSDSLLRNLRSLIDVPSSSNDGSGRRKVWLRNKSICDFLVSKERSGDLHQSSRTVHIK